MGELSKYKIPIIVVGALILIYIILILIAGSSAPILIMKDESMTHHFNYNSWMDEFALCDGLNCTQEIYLNGYDITKRSFLNFPFVDGINEGSIVFISKSKNIKQGDVIIIKQEGKRKTTRVLEIEKGEKGTILHTKSDMAPFIENKDTIILTNDKNNRYVGKALFKLF